MGVVTVDALKEGFVGVGAKFAYHCKPLHGQSTIIKCNLKCGGDKQCCRKAKEPSVRKAR